MTLVYGVAQAAFVAGKAWAPDQTVLWSTVLLVLVLGVGLLWGGTEVVLGRKPPEWTWFGASLVTGPAAGLLTWILLALFVDQTGVADLSGALFGRAPATVLMVLGSATLGSRLGWLSLRRRGEGADDPALDTDEAPDAEPTPVTTAAGVAPAPRLPRETTERVAARRGGARGARGPEVGAGGSGAGLGTGLGAGSGAAASAAGPADRADRGAGTAPGGAPGRSGPSRRRSRPSPTTTEPGTAPAAAAAAVGSPAHPDESPSPWAGGRRSGGRPDGPGDEYAPPVVAVLPTSEAPPHLRDRAAEAPATGDEHDAEADTSGRSRLRRFGMRRPGR